MVGHEEALAEGAGPGVSAVLVTGWDGQTPTVPFREQLRIQQAFSELDEAWALSLPTVSISQKEKDSLGSYDVTLPTGVRLGKRWLRKHHGHQLLVEYAPSPEHPGFMAIIYQRVDVL